MIVVFSNGHVASDRMESVGDKGTQIKCLQNLSFILPEWSL